MALKNVKLPATIEIIEYLFIGVRAVHIALYYDCSMQAVAGRLLRCGIPIENRHGDIIILCSKQAAISKMLKNNFLNS